MKFWGWMWPVVAVGCWTMWGANLAAAQQAAENSEAPVVRRPSNAVSSPEREGATLECLECSGEETERADPPNSSSTTNSKKSEKYVSSLPPTARPRSNMRDARRSEFQQMVADSAGRQLPIFGQSLFAQPPSTFAPADRAPAPGDYVLGPDDELQVRIWGQLNAELRLTVDRAGQVYLPQVGAVTVAGVRYRALEARLKAAVGRLYRDFELSASLGRLRSIQVYVVGQARDPGNYTVGALSTMVNAVFASGGPTAQGSLRDVQLQREGQVIAHLDLYELLVRGDKSHDVHLQTGDVIYFPPIGALAAIAGSVNAPAIYEIRPTTRLAELIETAGGLDTLADPQKVVIERIDDKRARTVMEFALDDAARQLVLRDGDIVRVLSLVPRFTDAVTLRGNVTNPGRYPWKLGMRIRDLIPNAQALLPRSYWTERTKMIDGRATEYPMPPRRKTETPQPREWRPTEKTSTTAAEPVETSETGELAGGEFAEKSNGLSTAGKETMTRSEARPETARETNNNNGNGRGHRSLARDLHQVSPEINWSYAIVQRLNPVDLSTRLLSFDLGKAVLEDDEANNLLLQPDDIVTIFSQADVAVAQNLRTRYVSIEGEVRRAGVYKLELGETLRDVVRRAGGLTERAYLYGTKLTRESARQQQQESLDEMERALESEIRQATLTHVARDNTEDAQTMAAAQAVQESLLAQLRAVRASGRVVLNLRAGDNAIDAYPAIEMEDNDTIVIPSRPSTVGVVGMVFNPGSFVYDERARVSDYLQLAGKGRPSADMHHAFVLHADGSVLARNSVNGKFTGDRFEQLRLHPGDQIVVPNKLQAGRLLRGLRDWTQITSQLALFGAAVAVMR